PWAVKGGADSALFAIDPATGALRFVSTPNFEAPADNGANNTYVVEIQALDANGNASVQTITVTVTDADEVAPAITGGATAATSIVENTTAVANLTANEAVTWSVKGGADSALFAIDPATGALRFVSAPNFEAPGDNGANNSYVVEVQALDASGNATVQTITVTVTDADEVAPANPGRAPAAPSLL
ncbi:cadherin repeat domain-containing protein, partial [Flavobacterium cupreum]